MRILIDADVILDVALDRAPHSAAASRLLSVVQGGLVDGYVAWHTISNVYYLLSSGRDRRKAIEMIRDLAGFVAVAPADSDTLGVALALEMRDFEDSMQVAAALGAGADAIVTRNVADYRQSPVRAFRPAEFLESLA